MACDKSDTAATNVKSKKRNGQTINMGCDRDDKKHYPLGAAGATLCATKKGE